jgi:plasmid stabilization system protein ParE
VGLAHLVDIFEYIALDSPIYATQIIERIIDRTEQLAEFPLSGRAVSGYEPRGLREIIEGPYRIIYRIDEHHIDILAVLHGSRRLPSDL